MDSSTPEFSRSCFRVTSTVNSDLCLSLDVIRSATGPRTRTFLHESENREKYRR